ncbi:lanthionine synthetase C family protein [Streptomyces sp. NPDC058734]|uniref:lanthionine synthetase C family protein n=1 Tax=Streptomyces sp. NPDC058734 TaxID=3346615 RepID=UPI0036AF0DA7
MLPRGTAAAALDSVATLAGRPRPAPACVRPDLDGGGPGIALVYHQLDQSLPGQGWDALAHGYLAASAAGAQRLAIRSPGLFGGLAGLAFTAWTLTSDPGMLPAVHDTLVREATARARTLGDYPHGTPVRTFDVVSGLAGVGAYLLCRHHEQQTRHALRAVLSALVALCREDTGTPHWHTPASQIRDAPTRQEFPHGMLNCGLAHGISGPLALLSLALSTGIVVPGHKDAVTRTARWLAAQHVNDAHGPTWAGKIAPAGRPAPSKLSTTSSSWCYGTPGIARSLWLAAAALDDPALRDLALQAIRAVHRRTATRVDAHDAPGLCHGLSGLLHITSRFAHDTKDLELTRAATELTERLLAPNTVTAADGPGYLDGAAGVALALLAAATDCPPAWDRTLLLA